MADGDDDGLVSGVGPRFHWPPDDPEFLARVSERVRAAGLEADVTATHSALLDAVRAEWPPDDPELLRRMGPG